MIYKFASTLHTKGKDAWNLSNKSLFYDDLKIIVINMVKFSSWTTLFLWCDLVKQHQQGCPNLIPAGVLYTEREMGDVLINRKNSNIKRKGGNVGIEISSSRVTAYILQTSSSFKQCELMLTTTAWG